MTEKKEIQERLAGSDYSGDTKASISLDSLDYVAFHGPYGKLVQKATAQMVGN
ncbi:hypothetical protein BY996DRAFT_6454361 [Phakopsora pachyrhizi]|nr:hypothetical protein BY996DRAFT_6454361 [Phakopsora pachyrhizi]